MVLPIDKISKKVSEELDLNQVLVDQINRSQYKFLLSVMESGTMAGVKLTYLGKFVKNKRYESSKRNISRIQEPDIPRPEDRDSS